jgi:hypothetical protein
MNNPPGGGHGSGQTKSDLQQHIAEAEEEEHKKSGAVMGSKTRFDEFECPTCDAYNPHTDFGNGDEVLCAYCGLAFDVEVDEDAKLKLREQ